MHLQLKAGMVLDGSFRISKFNKTDGLNFSISELPGHNGTRYNFSSFWANALSTKAKGERSCCKIFKILNFGRSDAGMA